jgi:hypothetical protein
MVVSFNARFSELVICTDGGEEVSFVVGATPAKVREMRPIVALI